MKTNRNFRTLHLIDGENLDGNPRPSRARAAVISDSYHQLGLVGPDDLVIVGCNHGAALSFGPAWSGARLVVGSGQDGADHALLGALAEHDVADRFDRVVVASGDGIFAGAVATLAGEGVDTCVVSRPTALSRQLRLAAGGNIVAFEPADGPEAPPLAVPALAQEDAA